MPWYMGLVMPTYAGEPPPPPPDDVVCATWSYTLPSLANEGNVPDYPLTEDVENGTATSDGRTVYPLTQRTFSNVNGGTFYASPDPRNCNQATTSLVITQIPSSVVDALTALAVAGGDAEHLVHGFAQTIYYLINWNGYQCIVRQVCTSWFQGTVFVPTTRLVTYQMGWHLRDPEGTVLFHQTLEPTTFDSGSPPVPGTLSPQPHPMAGSYAYTGASFYPEMGATYLQSPSDIARLGDVFPTMAIETFGVPF